MRWLKTIAISLLLAGCAAHKRGSPGRVPGCDMSRVTAAPNCQLVPYPDHLEQHCERQVLVNGKSRTEVFITKYTCTTNQTKEENQ